MEINHQTSEEGSGNKTTVGFKCNPALRASLSQQADKLGITLSSHIEALLSSEDATKNEFRAQAEKLKNLEESITFYENAPLLQALLKECKGQIITYLDRGNKETAVRIDSIRDVFNIIINSFKTEK